MFECQDMVQLRSYFLFSALTMSTTIVILNDEPVDETLKLYILDSFIIGHHMFCYLTWNHSAHCKKVRHH